MIRKTKIKKTTIPSVGKTGTHIADGNRNWKTIWQFLIKCIHTLFLLYDSVIPFLDIYPRERYMSTQCSYMKLLSCFIHNSQKLERT